MNWTKPEGTLSLQEDYLGHLHVQYVVFFVFVFCNHAVQQHLSSAARVAGGEVPCSVTPGGGKAHTFPTSVFQMNNIQ